MMNNARTEEEIINLILHVANLDSRIRVVGLNGSRVNANAPKDRLQDYDVAYIVTNMDAFKADEHWIDAFGPRIILQKPEAMSLFPPTLGNWFSYLMLLEDGNRIDIMLIPLNELSLYLADDKLTAILLDKDQLVGTIPAPSDETHWIKPPSEQYFRDCCNEFWWLGTYVAKGLCRREILYAIDHIYLLRQQLLTMIAWRVGSERGFSFSVGKNYKYLDKYIPEEEFKALLATYRNDSLESVNEALWNCICLFRAASGAVAKRMAYTYPEFDKKVSGYLDTLLTDACTNPNQTMDQPA